MVALGLSTKLYFAILFQIGENSLLHYNHEALRP